MIVDFPAPNYGQILVIKRCAHCFTKSPTLDESANILEILYTS
jgi:hypothetical protein